MSIVMTKVVMEGQEITLPEQLTEDDETLRKALAPFYPEIANATISRATKEGVQTINIVKKAGTKG